MDPLCLSGSPPGLILEWLPFSTLVAVKRVCKKWNENCKEKINEWSFPLHCGNKTWREWKKNGLATAKGWLVYDGGDTAGVEGGKEFTLIGMTEPLMFPRADYLPLTWLSDYPEAIHLSMTLTVSISTDVILQGLNVPNMSLEENGFGLRITPTNLSLLHLKSGGEPSSFWSKEVTSSATKHITMLYSYDSCFIKCSDTETTLTDIWTAPHQSDEFGLHWTVPISKYTMPPNPAALLVSSQGKTSISSACVTGAIRPSRHNYLKPAVSADEVKNQQKKTGGGKGGGKKGGKGRKGKGRR